MGLTVGGSNEYMRLNHCEDDCYIEVLVDDEEEEEIEIIEIDDEAIFFTMGDILPF